MRNLPNIADLERYSIFHGLLRRKLLGTSCSPEPVPVNIFPGRGERSRLQLLLKLAGIVTAAFTFRLFNLAVPVHFRVSEVFFVHLRVFWSLKPALRAFSGLGRTSRPDFATTLHFP